MSIRHKLAAGLGVIALVAASAVVAPTAASAVGVTYGTITLSPAGPYLPGDQVTVTASGMANQAPPPLADPAGAPNNGGGLLAAICVGNGNPQVGPSSCTTPSQTSTGVAPLASYGFGVPASQDSFSATLSIPNNTTNYFPDYPTYVCGNGAANQCLIGISDFRGNGPTQIPITYAYGSLSVTPAGPYVNGQSVTMNYTGLVSPSAGNTNGGGWSYGICVGGTNPQLGPGSCSSTTGGFDFVGGASGSYTISVVKGAAGFTDYPGYTCGNGAGNECNFTISDFRGKGPKQIPISFVKETPTVTLTADPSSIAEGDSVTLTADVSPAIDGTVQFKDGTTNLGSPVTVTAGSADYTTSALAQGTRSLSAVFSPADSGNYNNGTGTLSYSVAKTAAVTTNTALSVTPSAGEAFSAVVLRADVTQTSNTLGRTLAGTVRFKEGTTLLGSAALSAGAAEITFNTFTEGVHSITAQFVPTDATDYVGSTSSPVDFTASAPLNPPYSQDVDVTVVPGSMSITTPYSAASPFDLGDATVSEDGSEIVASGDFGTAASGGITITDTRAGNQAWTASAIATDFTDGSSNTISANDLSLTGLTQVYTAGNALQSGDVTVTDVAALGDTQKAFASTTNGNGTVRIYGTLGLNAPTSTVAGTYTATLTFTIA
jgi:hypothetical protein